MIARISGILIEKKVPNIIIDVNGVGYGLLSPMSTIYQLPEVGEKVTLHTEFIVREDAHILYGFLTEAERSLFQKIIKVSGIGPKLGLGILSSLSPQEFVQIVLKGDSASLVSLPGVGKKTAERLVLEMQDKLQKEYIVGLNSTETMTQTVMSSKNNQPMDDAQAALVALGYKPKEAQKALDKVKEQNLTSEELIKQALQGLVKI